MAKVRKQYNQVPHLTQDTTRDRYKNTINITNKSQEVSPFPAGDHKAAMSRHESMRNTRHKNPTNDPQKKQRLGTVSKNILLESIILSTELFLQQNKWILLVLLLLTFCLLLLPLWESVIVLCVVVCYFMSILVLQSSWWGRESWLLCLICLPCVSWWLSGSFSRCHGVVCSLYCGISWSYPLTIFYV